MSPCSDPSTSSQFKLMFAARNAAEDSVRAEKLGRHAVISAQVAVETHAVMSPLRSLDSQTSSGSFPFGETLRLPPSLPTPSQTKG